MFFHSRQILVLLTALAGLPAFAEWSNTDCKVTDFSDTTAEAIEKLQRPVALAWLEADANDFCNNEMSRRFLFAPVNVRDKKSGDKATRDQYNQAALDGKLEKLIDDIAVSPKMKNGFSSAWEYTLVPTEKQRAKVASSNQFDESNTDSTCIDESKSTMTKAFGAKEKRKLIEDMVADRESATKASCYEILGVLRSGSCSVPMKTIFRIAMPSEAGMNVTGMEIYKRVLNNPRYVKGLLKASNIVSKRVSEKTESKSDYFTDVKQGFLDAGESPESAEEMAWNVVGMIGTAGPNLNVRLSDLTGRKLNDAARAAMRLSLNLPLLDHRAGRKGKLYSWPEGVDGSCNTGKSYHFWYTAYLARRAALESGDPEASAVSAFQVAKTYQGLRQKFNCNSRTVSETPLLGSTAEVMRADLSYQAAGAVFGANRAGDRKSKVNIDRALRELILNAGEGSVGLAGTVAYWVKGDMGAKYADFQSKFAPNTAYSLMAKDGFTDQVNSKYLDVEPADNVPTCK